MLEILKLSLQDFFTKRFLKFTLLPLFFSFVLFVVLCYFGFSYLLDFFETLFGGNPEASVMAWIYSFAFVQVLIGIISFLASSFIVIFASVFFSIFIISFLTPFIVKELNQKYYHCSIQTSVSFIALVLKTLWILVKFGFFFCCALILLFVPFVNLFIFYVVFYYLFHKLLLLDVASSVLDSESFKKFYTKTSPLEFKFSTLCFYILALVPFLGLFMQVFFVIFLSHLFYQRVLKMQVKI